MTATKIMIVEDERIVALDMRLQLTRFGYEVVGVASSGEDALRKIIEQRPDVVLMDINIEGPIDGIETCSRIPAEIGAAVIYVAAYSEEATLQRASATKPHGYLTKPYAERELHAAIQMALERKRADMALRASEDRIRSIFNEVGDGILILDAATGTLIEANEPGCRMFGYSTDELIGRDMQALSSGVAPYTQLEAAEWIDRAAATGEAQRFRWHCKTKKGRVFPAEISMRIASIADRQVVLSIIRDLTEREAFEAQLRQSQKMEAVGQLTGGLAHDFNNLLSVIIGNLDMLREADPHDDQTEEFVEDALEAAMGGAELTRQLLAFARRQPLQPQRIDLKTLVSGTVKLLKRVLGEQIQIVLTFEDEPCLVLADQAQLETALTNLATNARDAMPRGGNLLISTGIRTLDADYVALNPEVQQGEYAMIEVTDTGVGMPPEVINHIFEPFYTTKERDKGTGLGLSMVFGFLKQSGGHISVYSEVGVGTTFRLYLPQAAGVGGAKAIPAAENIAASKGERVLVVEDNAPLRRIAVKQLRELGYVVLEESNGLNALETLASAKVDVLFTDIVMAGGLDGFELARTAKQRWPHLEIILTSGYPATKLNENVASTDFPLLSKPYGKASLARIFREVLKRSDSRGEATPRSATPAVAAPDAFIVDDEPRIQALISKVLVSVGFTPLRFGRVEDVEAALTRVKPELIILDLSLGESDAIDVMRRLAAAQFSGKILLVSGHDPGTIGDVQRIGERYGLEMLPFIRKPFAIADLKSRLGFRTAGISTSGVDIGAALENDWLEVWYQPKVDLKSMLVCGAEALVRLRHPQRGIFLPAAFLPGPGDPLYKPLTDFVKQRSLNDWVQLRAAGIAIRLAINVPASILQRADFVAEVRKYLPKQADFPGLIVEITEDEALSNPEFAREVAIQLKLYNIQVAIDDFGTGYSTLARLDELPFAELKLDRRFVQGCSSDESKRTICQSVVNLAHRFEITAVAEGIEADDDLKTLIDLNYDVGQGYLFSKPMAFGDFIDMPISQRH